ncbi:MAG: ATP-binding protein [Elusimicrobia bacterium]|nr:ATP-binding protein [Elusimicrobiota bacterium]
MRIIDRYLAPLKQSFFLFGPRGTGKTSWIKENFKEALYIDFLDPKIFRLYSAYPERLNEIIEGNPGKNDIVIDEIQRVPQVLPVIHSLIEDKKNLRFILTGSSSRKIRKTGTDLLGGRAVSLSMYPFMASELGGSFSLDKALSEGLVPLIVSSNDSLKTLAGYITLYIKEEIQAEALVRNIPSFARFIEAVSFSHGAVLNVSAISRECQVERKTVEGYIKILEDLLLSFKLNVFTKRAKRKVIEHPKFYIFDVGVFRNLRPKGPFDRPQEIDGAALEGLVAQNIKAWIDYRGKDNKLYYWRTPKGIEIDFIVYGEDGIFAIEVKNSSKIYPENIRGLEFFKEDYPEAQCLLLYRGTERIKKGNVLCLPCESFLKDIKPGKNILK